MSSMKSLKDLLQHKAHDIDASGVRTDIDLVQAELDRFYEGQVQLTKINKGQAIVQAQSAPVAANLRMQQHQLVEDLNSSLKNKLTRFIIRIA